MDLCERLGLKNTATSVVIKRGTIMELTLPNDLERTMGLRASQGEDKTSDV